MRSPRLDSALLGAAACLAAPVSSLAFAVEGNLVLSHVKLDDTSLGGAQFGLDVTGIGDANGDGIGDIAVGARNDDDGGTDRGSFWLIFLDENGAAVAPSPLKFADTARPAESAPARSRAAGSIDVTAASSAIPSTGRRSC